MNETGLRSAKRFMKRNQRVTAKGRVRQAINIPEGNRITRDVLIGPLANFLAGKLAPQPDKPPVFLRELVQELVQELDGFWFLALAALAPLLGGIFRGWDREDPSWKAKLKLKIGELLYRRLKFKIKVDLRWSESDRLHAGNWLLEQALHLDFFDKDTDGFYCISAECEPKVAQLREVMIAEDPAYAPHLKQPPPWTGWWKTYDDGFHARFVRDWRPQTEAAIEAAFLDDPDWDHAKGVNALSRVPLKIDADMVALVDRFAVELMGNVGTKRKADETRVKADVEDAKWCDEHGPTFWNDYNCDKRGRIFALQHLNFAREDHVRSLFRFANGTKLGGDPKWLEIHCANCAGYDKESRDDRRKWVTKHRQDIQKIARDPIGTFENGGLDGKGWKEAEKPFQFVASCLELAAAWEDPANFETHLPVGFDGSANGLQHLSLLIRDKATADMVNLSFDPDHPAPKDAYAKVIAAARVLIETDPCDHAHWWRECFKKLSDKKQRKLLKQPIMTFAYSVRPFGAADQIAEVYESFGQNAKPPKGAFLYLAKKVLQACELELRGPKIVMNYACKVAEHCTDQGRFLEWTSPSGFPVSNQYQVPYIKAVTCLIGGVRVATHEIADGVTDKINLGKVKASAAPNFVHSLDAAHLIKVVNAAVSEGITDLLTVHDCFYCPAPQAERLQKIILDEMQNLYRDYDPLGDLRSRNVSDPDILPVPRVLFKCVNGEWEGLIPFHLPDVQDADNAFG